MGRITRAMPRRSAWHALLTFGTFAVLAAPLAALDAAARSHPVRAPARTARPPAAPITARFPSLWVRGDFLSEGFEGTAFPPSGWTYTPIHPTNRWARTTSPTWVRSGVGAALIRTQSTSTQDEKLVSLPVDVSSSSGTDLRLSFWWRTDPFWFQGVNTIFQVHASLDGTNWTQIFTLTGFTETGWAWRNTVLDLSSYAGQAGLLRVRFRYKGLNAADLSLDDVVVGYLAPPAPPLNDDCAGADAHGYVLGPADGAFHVTGNNLLATDDYPLTAPQSCTGYTHDGKDVVWKVLLPAHHGFDATMTPVGGWDVTLFAIGNCADAAGSCVSGARGFGGGAHVSVANANAVAATYWLVASGYGSAAGDFAVDGTIAPTTATNGATWGRVKAAYRSGGG